MSQGRDDALLHFFALRKGKLREYHGTWLRIWFWAKASILSQVRSSNGCCRMTGIRIENGFTAAVSEVPSIGTMATCHRPGRPFQELSVAAVIFKKEKELRGSPKLSLKFQCFGG